MRRYSLLILTLALLVICTAAGAALFPGPFPGMGDGLVTAHLQQGWYNGIPVWYICTDTNNIRFANAQHLTLAPKLTSAEGTTARSMIIVTNPPASQGPIFSAMPQTKGYTGLWEVIYVTFRAGATRVPICSLQQLLALFEAGAITVAPSVPAVIMDCPILVVGSLGAPIYKIPEGTNINYLAKTIQLPFYNVYCQNPITRAISVQRVIVTEASSQPLAAALGANFAPSLATMPIDDRGLMFSINPRQDINLLPGIQPLKVLANQYPVKCDCPNPCGPANTNYAYSPVESIVFLNRLFPGPLSPECLFTNCDPIFRQIEMGNLIPVFFPTPPLPGGSLLPQFPPIPGSPDVNAPFVCGQF